MWMDAKYSKALTRLPVLGGLNAGQGMAWRTVLRKNEATTRLLYSGCIHAIIPQALRFSSSLDLGCRDYSLGLSFIQRQAAPLGPFCQPHPINIVHKTTGHQHNWTSLHLCWDTGRSPLRIAIDCHLTKLSTSSSLPFRRLPKPSML